MGPMPKHVFRCLVAVVGLTGCDPSPGPLTSDLPNEPLLQPGTRTVVFALSATDDSDIIDVTFVNGGQRKVELRAIRVEDSAGRFQIESIVPDFPREKLVEPRGALGVRVRFTSAGRGVTLGKLVVESNAGNGGVQEIELVGPGADDPIPSAPDIAAFETQVSVESRPGYDVPVALARYFNLGGQALTVREYRLRDLTQLTILPGTPVPNLPCEPAGECGPVSDVGQGCCDLACRGICDGGAWDGQTCSGPCPGLLVGDPEVECLDMRCEPVRVVGGDYRVVPIGFADEATSGPYNVAFEVTSNDPDRPTVGIAVQGSRE